MAPKTTPAPRVVLRHPLPSDAEEFLALRRRSRAFHGPWEPTSGAGEDRYSPVAFERYLEYRTDPRVERLFVCAAGDGAILGAIHLSEIVRGVFQSAYLGYWVDVEQAGRGYMREGFSLALHHAFETLGLHRVEANIRPENTPSIALVRGAGFRLEGFSPAYLNIDGAWRDHERWALLAEEWRANRGRGNKPGYHPG